MAHHLLAKGRKEKQGQDKEARKTSHLAVSCGYEEVAKLLIKAGADVDAQHKYGRTPLDSPARLAGKGELEKKLKNFLQEREGLMVSGYVRELGRGYTHYEEDIANIIFSYIGHK